MIKWFLLGDTIISLICVAVSFSQYAVSDDKKAQIYYKRLLIDFGYFVSCFLISVTSLLFGWI